MYKTEPHLHSFPLSSCSHLPVDDLIRRHGEAGYATVILADHFSRYHYAKLELYLKRTLTWEEYVDQFYQTWEAAKAAGEKYGVRVLFAVELSLSVGHFLLYGVDRAFLLSRPDVFELTPDALHAHARANGVTVIQAHPLRDGLCTPYPEQVDGFEVFNSHPRHNNENDRVRQIADRYPHLLRTVGSDVHRPEDVGGSAVLSETPIESVEQYLELLRSGKAQFEM